VASDSSNTLLADLKTYLRFAASKNVFVNLTLWNGALMRNKKYEDLIHDTGKLQTFVDTVLTPLAKGLAGEPGLGAWEIMNEPEGSVKIEHDDEPCFNTQDVLRGSGAGWAG